MMRPPSVFAISTATLGLLQTGVAGGGAKLRETYRARVFRTLRESQTPVSLSLSTRPPSSSSSSSTSSPPLISPAPHSSASSTTSTDVRTNRKAILPDAQNRVMPSDVLLMAMKEEARKEMIVQDGKSVSDSSARTAETTNVVKERWLGGTVAARAPGVETKEQPNGKKMACEAEKAAAAAKKSATEATASATVSVKSATSSAESATLSAGSATASAESAAVSQAGALAATEAAAEAAAIAAALAAAEAAAAAAKTQTESDALEECLRLAESNVVPQQQASEANRWAVRRARHTLSWFVPRLNCATGFLFAAFVTVFVLLSALYFIYHDWISESPYVYVALYWVLFGTLFAAVAFYVLMRATAANYDTERTTNSDTLERGALAFLFLHWPLTDTLLKSLYPDDPLLRNVRVPAALLPLLDPNLVLFVDIISCNLLIDVINLTVILQPLQPPGKLVLWRRWFSGSALLRQAWVYRRAYVDDATALFIDQNLLVGSEHPEPSLWAKLTSNPVKFIAWVVALVTIIAFVAYVWWATAAEGPLREKLELFATIFGEFYTSAALIAIVFDNSITVADTQFNYDENFTSATNETLVAGYPHTIPFFKSILPCNALVDQLRIPPTVDPDLARVVGFGGARVFFQSIATSLKLQSPPPAYKVRGWRAEFKSCYIRTDWPAARPTFKGDELHFIETQLYLQPECKTFYMPPEYSGRGWLCCRPHSRFR
jgi:hypothetical protein